MLGPPRTQRRARSPPCWMLLMPVLLGWHQQHAGCPAPAVSSAPAAPARVLLAWPPLRLRGGGRDDPRPHGEPPPHLPRSQWRPSEQDDTGAKRAAWEDRQRERGEAIALHEVVTTDQARGHLEPAMDAALQRRAREEALHRQLAQHIRRLKEAHAQITSGCHPSPPETACSSNGSPHRVRHRSRPPSESLGPAPACLQAPGRSSDAQQVQPSERDVQLSKASTDWQMEGTEERVLQHRQQVVRKVLGASQDEGSSSSSRPRDVKGQGSCVAPLHVVLSCCCGVQRVVSGKDVSWRSMTTPNPRR